MLDFTKDEITLLVEDGYEPGFMMDIQEGDLVAIAPVSRVSFDNTIKAVKTFVIQRIIRSDASYYSEESDQLIPHTVISFIGMNLDNLPEHCSYGNTYPCFIKREK